MLTKEHKGYKHEDPIITTKYSANLNKMGKPTREPARDENKSSRI
jgi:hypothetical protein